MKKHQKNFSLVKLLIVVAVVGILAFAATPKLFAADTEFNERSAIQSLRAITYAQGTYRATIGAGRVASNTQILVDAGLLDSSLGCTSTCQKDGYAFSITMSIAYPAAFVVIAVPQICAGISATGTRSFLTIERGIIYQGSSCNNPTVTDSTRIVSSGFPIYNMFPNKIDFDGFGKSELTVYRPSTGVWYRLRNNPNFVGYDNVQFGAANDRLVPADYDGFGQTKIGVYRDGFWHFAIFYPCCYQSIQFGEANDIPVPADYDGDGKANIAVFRPSNGTWYIRQPNESYSAIAFGQNGDKPVAGDFDGDGKADLAVFRPSEGIWYIQQSSQGFKAVAFGFADDKLVAADYDGDGKMDIAVYRPSNGTWYLNQSRDGMKVFQFGISTDLPVPADYDGDGKADIAVFRDGVWYIQNSANQQIRSVQFGASDDKPVANAFVR